jgi:hypothetical protein
MKALTLVGVNQFTSTRKNAQVVTGLQTSCYKYSHDINKNVTRLTPQGCNNIVMSWLYRTCWNNYETSLIISKRLLQIVNSLFQTCWHLSKRLALSGSVKSLFALNGCFTVYSCCLNVCNGIEGTCFFGIVGMMYRQAVQTRCSHNIPH